MECGPNIEGKVVGPLNTVEDIHSVEHHHGLKDLGLKREAKGAVHLPHHCVHAVVGDELGEEVSVKHKRSRKASRQPTQK